MRIYIAGPMRGKPLFNFPAFDKARDELIEQGHEPVSPADIDREHGFDEHAPVEVDVRECLKRDCVALLDCEAVALLPGWEDSMGARAEAMLAAAVGMDVYLIKEVPV
jgi:hypothetical protein